MRFPRPTIASGPLCVLTALYLLAFTNTSFWQKLALYFTDHPMKLVLAALAILLIHIAVLLVFSAKFVIKPALILAILIGAGGAYFTDVFGTIIDRNVIEATLTTTRAESGQLITARFILHMLLYGVMPSLLIVWVRIKHRPILQKIAVNAVAIIGCLIGFIALIGSDFGSFSSMYREHRSDIMERMMPGTPIKSLVQYVVHDLKDRQIVMQPLGLDARQTIPPLRFGKKLLTVVVVGETARAKNFSLYGYDRDTNPELGKQDIVTFTNTTSCGTDTAVSVPCMFSPFPRTEYSSSKFHSSENLMDVLNHAGVQLAWYENNTGSKGVADRILDVDLQNSGDVRYCDGGECRDQILVDYLKDHLKDFNGNATVILHMTGSHGPAYYRRYPTGFAKFIPECRTSEFSDCTIDQIVNSYDNSILYTDHILSEVIDLLKANRDRFAPAMIYMSDHGESLGEDGLYLHAAPYFIAPDEQTHIPFIAWFSPDYATATQLDTACIKQDAATPASHDNLFHTIIGMMGVKTVAYDPTLDRFARCRKAHIAATN
ncbi:phosphoethanolamine transferase [Ochrobactrum sp. CM-21-5]|nr:phosphoethanolamine--lipid A transferase [Ochrobactrum sp. CM-21-5]MBC2883803.1 phosphoethanolamine transferase [Ochrobactrum sp. CM-21-5]